MPSGIEPKAAERPKAAESGGDSRWCSHVPIRVSTVLTCGGSERDPVSRGSQAPGRQGQGKVRQRRMESDEGRVTRGKRKMVDGGGEGRMY